MMMPTSTFSLTSIFLPYCLSETAYCTSIGQNGDPNSSTISAFETQMERIMPIDGKLLEILCCPVSKTPLTRLPSGRLKKLNDAIAGGDVQYVNGDTVQESLREALVTEDSKVIYPVVDGIPVLLGDKGIGTTQLTDF
jgi:uncharacterized protein YbaR (Trm112 family)